MDGRSNRCRWTQTKKVHSEHLIIRFSLVFGFLLSFLTPKGDAIIRLVSCASKALFFFFRCLSTSPDVMRKKRLRTDCATCCILSEEGDRPSIPIP